MLPWLLVPDFRVVLEVQYAFLDRLGKARSTNKNCVNFSLEHAQ